MYTTKYTNPKICESYTSIGDPYLDRNPNPFRQPKKGEKAPTPFQVTVSKWNYIFYRLNFMVIKIL